MSARKLVVALGQRRRSALELRGAVAQSTTQLLARYRRASLQADACRQHELIVLSLKRTQKESEEESEDDARGSQRSSASTTFDDDENSSPDERAQHPEARDRLLHFSVVEPALSDEEEDDDDLDEEADRLAPLPSNRPRRCGSTHRKLSSSTTSTASSTGSQPRHRFETVLRDHPQQELYLFREEAEYSDYVNAVVTGAHTEMDSVVFYEVDVHLSQMKWQVLRRFSEFRQLRQRLLKHLSRRQRFQSAAHKCRICANILQTIEQAPFPSRKQRQPWFSVLRSRVSKRKHLVRSAAVIADRKRKLQDFVAACLLTVRGLRQHSRLMYDSTACEISVALRMIEEFLGLSFTRYMRFLNERGILATDDKPTKGKGKSHNVDHHAALRLGSSSVAGRRATVAV